MNAGFGNPPAYPLPARPPAGFHTIPEIMMTRRAQFAAFLAALLSFAAATTVGPSQALAATSSACGVYGVMICYTEVYDECVAIDSRTGQCTQWRTLTKYYYYDGHSGCGDRICPT
jgi:hypothetical protein